MKLTGKLNKTARTIEKNPSKIKSRATNAANEIAAK